MEWLLLDLGILMALLFAGLVAEGGSRAMAWVQKRRRAKLPIHWD